MRGTMDGDVAAERRLNAIKDLLKVLPRSRGFRVSADGSVSVYPATQRAWRFSAAKQEGSLKSKRASRSEQGSKRAATNARTRRSAARAAKHAEITQIFTRSAESPIPWCVPCLRKMAATLSAHATSYSSICEVNRAARTRPQERHPWHTGL